MYNGNIDLQENSILYEQCTTPVRIAIAQILASEGGVRHADTPAFSPHLMRHFLRNSTALAGGGSKCIVYKDYYSLIGL